MYVTLSMDHIIIDYLDYIHSISNQYNHSHLTVQEIYIFHDIIFYLKQRFY